MTQCERIKRTLSSFTQATMEISFLFDNTDFSLLLSTAQFPDIEHGMFEIRVLEADPGCKGSGIHGRVLGIHSLMHVFSDLSQVTL